MAARQGERNFPLPPSAPQTNKRTTTAAAAPPSQSLSGLSPLVPRSAVSLSRYLFYFSHMRLRRPLNESQSRTVFVFDFEWFTTRCATTTIIYFKVCTCPSWYLSAAITSDDGAQITIHTQHDVWRVGTAVAARPSAVWDYNIKLYKYALGRWETVSRRRHCAAGRRENKREHRHGSREMKLHGGRRL